MVDDLDPCEEEEKGKSEVGEERDIHVDFGDPHVPQGR